MTALATLDAVPTGLANTSRSRSLQGGTANTAGEPVAGISPGGSFRDNWQAFLTSLHPGAAQFETEEDASGTVSQYQPPGEGFANRNVDEARIISSNDEAPLSSQLLTGMQSGQVAREAMKTARLSPELLSSSASERKENAKTSSKSLKTETGPEPRRKWGDRQSVEKAKITAKPIGSGSALATEQSFLNTAAQLQTGPILAAALSTAPAKGNQPVATAADHHEFCARVPMTATAFPEKGISRPATPELPSVELSSAAGRIEETTTPAVPVDAGNSFERNIGETGVGSQVGDERLENTGILSQNRVATSAEISQDSAIHFDHRSLTGGTSTRPAGVKQISPGETQPADAFSDPLSTAQRSFAETNRPRGSVSESGTSLFHADLPAAGSKKEAKTASWSGTPHTGRTDNSEHPQLFSFGSLVTDAPRASHMVEGEQAGVSLQRGVDGPSGSFNAESTFNALESGTSTELAPHAASRATPAPAEAGYQDPLLGWVGIRAESSGGAIHATLTSSSSETAQALSGHMAGLHTYLAENRTPVDTITLVSSGGPGGQLAGQDGGRGMRQDTGRQMNQHSNAERSLSLRESTGERPDVAMRNSLAMSVVTPAAGHISVLA